MIYSLCNWGREDADEGPTWRWAPAFAQQWRTTTDIFPWYGRVYAILDENARLAPFARPGANNDPDMLEVGVEGHLLNVPGFPRSASPTSQAAPHLRMASTAAPERARSSPSSAPPPTWLPACTRSTVASSTS